jgi:hypothetical protein
MSYNGWISFDIIQKPNGEFYYIECNPRTCLGLCLFNPTIIAQTLLESAPKVNIIDGVTIGSKSQMALVSIECLLRKLFKGKLQLKDLKYLMTSEDIIFDRQDLYPYFYQFICYLYVKWIALKLKTNFLYAGTRDLEWN